MKNRLKVLVGTGAALAMVAALQVSTAHAFAPQLDGATECMDNGSIAVTWTYVSGIGVDFVDIVSPEAIAADNVPTTTNGEPTVLTFTETLPAGSTAASTSVTVEFGDSGVSNTTSKTLVLSGDECATPAGGEWCSPGYWRQPQHLDSWDATGISPDDAYNDYFGPVFADNPTLLQVLESPQTYNRKGNGSFNNVGDLLSGAHPDVDFDGERAENCPLS